jgi:hypothetical protein
MRSCRLLTRSSSSRLPNGHVQPLQQLDFERFEEEDESPFVRLLEVEAA